MPKSKPSKRKSINLVDLQSAFAEVNNIRRPKEPAYVVHYFLANDTCKVEVAKEDDHGKVQSVVHVRDKWEEPIRIRGRVVSVNIKYGKWRIFYNARSVRAVEAGNLTDYTLIAAPLHAWFVAGFAGMIEASAEEKAWKGKNGAAKAERKLEKKAA